MAIHGSSGGIGTIVEDTTPQLGGNLDVNGKKITSVSNGDIDIEPNGTGDVLLGNFTFDADQSVGAGQDNYVLTYDNAGGKISLEAAAGGGGDFADGGDAGGANRSLGNTDNYSLDLLTNNTSSLLISNDGKLSTGAETAPDVDIGGVCLNMGDTNAFAISVKSDLLNHGMTTIAETDTNVAIKATQWDVLTTGSTAINFRGFATTENTATTTAAVGPATFSSFLKDGTGTQSLAANANIFVVRNTSSACFIVKGDGDCEADGTVSSNSFDFAEYFESTDGKAIPDATPVVLDKGKIRQAIKGEVPFGVISATAAFVGNKGLDWQGRYKRDNFGAILLDSDNKPIESDDYDKTQEFISRENREEWNVVGLLGQVYIRKGSPLNPDWIFIKDANEDCNIYLIK